MVADFHLLQNRGTIVGDSDVSVGGDQDLVEATGAEGGLDEVGNGSRGQDMGFNGLVSELALLLSLAMRLSGAIRTTDGVI